MMTKLIYSRKTPLIALIVISLVLFTRCSDDGKTIPKGNVKVLSPKTIELQTESDTSIFTIHTNSVGKIEKITNDKGFEFPVTYTGENITGISNIYSAKYNSNNQRIESLADYGSFKSRTDLSYINDNLSELTIFNMVKQSDGTFSEELAAEITDIDFGSQHQGALTYTTYNAGAVHATYDGKFSYNDMKNNLQNFAPYAMMNEFNDQLYGFINMGYKYAITDLELTNQATNAKITYEANYYQGNNGAIKERHLTFNQGPVVTKKQWVFFTY